MQKTDCNVRNFIIVEEIKRIKGTNEDLVPLELPKLIQIGELLVKVHKLSASSCKGPGKVSINMNKQRKITRKENLEFQRK